MTFCRYDYTTWTDAQLEAWTWMFDAAVLIRRNGVRYDESNRLAATAYALWSRQGRRRVLKK